MNTESTPAEIELAKKVKNDLRTGQKRQKDTKQIILMAPLNGRLLSDFNVSRREGVDIAAKKDTPVLSCLAGTVVYAGFSAQEGYVIVIEHADGFVSSYKHAKAVLKKQGDKVQVSDPIALVGNYGSSYKEPHIHFELWLNQASVNPADYIRFE
jgi:murein DD-endopeptidase MepM/ murein hydrolase activator NlpD